MGEHFEGANAEELQADLDAARDAGNMEVVRYLEHVQEDRKQKKAIVESHDIVLGNPGRLHEADGGCPEGVRRRPQGRQGEVRGSGLARYRGGRGRRSDGTAVGCGEGRYGHEDRGQVRHDEGGCAHTDAAPRVGSRWTLDCPDCGQALVLVGEKGPELIVPGPRPAA
jgi:hypothetical protein